MKVTFKKIDNDTYAVIVNRNADLVIQIDDVIKRRTNGDWAIYNITQDVFWHHITGSTLADCKAVMRGIYKSCLEF